MNFDYQSRPYGDGLFYRVRPLGEPTRVPSLRGWIVLLPERFRVLCCSPVPTGTDCSNFIILDFGMGVSRPYWDGLFLREQKQ